MESLCEQPEDALECRSGNSATPAFYIGPNMIECTTPWHEVPRLVVFGIGSSESKDVFLLFEFEFLNPFELGSIRSDSGSVKGGTFVSVGGISVQAQDLVYCNFGSSAVIASALLQYHLTSFKLSNNMIYVLTAILKLFLFEGGVGINQSESS